MSEMEKFVSLPYNIFTRKRLDSTPPPYECTREQGRVLTTRVCRNNIKIVFKEVAMGNKGRQWLRTILLVLIVIVAASAGTMIFTHTAFAIFLLCVLAVLVFLWWRFG
jgi:hypothetical protein